MTSSEFTIDFDTIEFLVGGGPHEGKTCVNLIVDGKTVLSATGKANNQMSLNTWNVRGFAGKKAKIQVVDNHTTGWGNIGIDHIVFTKLVPTQEGHDSQTRGCLITPHPRIWLPAVPRKTSFEHGDRNANNSPLRLSASRDVAPAMLDGTGEDDRILIRGNSSKPGDIEPRHFLTADLRRLADFDPKRKRPPGTG